MFAAVARETVHVAYFLEFDVMGARKLSFVYPVSRKVERIRAACRQKMKKPFFLSLLSSATQMMDLNCSSN